MPTVIVHFVSAVKVSRGRPKQNVKLFSGAEGTISTNWRKGVGLVNQFPAYYVIQIFFLQAPDKFTQGGLVVFFVFK